MKKKKVFLAIESSHVYGRGILSGISRYVQERKHWQIHLEGRGLYEDFYPWLKDWEGDGIIVRTSSPKMTTALKKVRVPIVELMGDGLCLHKKKENQSEIRTDEQMICEMAIGHFYDWGIRNVAFYSYGSSWWLRDRSRCFDKVSQKYGIRSFQYHEASDRTTSVSPYITPSQKEEIVEWLRELPKPVGIWGGTDLMAIRLMNICLESNFLIPDEIRIMGTDNDLHFCLMANPKLTSIDLAPERVGYESARLLDLKMNGQPIPYSLPLSIPPNGVFVRASTKGFAIDDSDAAHIIHYIRENAIFGLTVADVQKEFCIIPRTLQRIVKKALGRTPEEELQHVRIEHACHLLIETDLPFNSVAEMSGFHSPEYFTKAFRKVMGKTPSFYRKEHLGYLKTERRKD